MTVEEKPDVTYNDVGGAKEQLEKLREVVDISQRLHRAYVYVLFALLDIVLYYVIVSAAKPRFCHRATIENVVEKKVEEKTNNK